MSELSGLLDANVTIKGHPLEEKIRDAIQLQAYDEPKEALKLYIGISGIQYCGVSAHESIPIFLVLFHDLLHYFRLECLKTFERSGIHY